MNKFIIGKWFHSFENPEDRETLKWQGQVLDIYHDYVLVQLYEWGNGSASTQQIVEMDEMVGWHFFETSEQMKKEKAGC